MDNEVSREIALIGDYNLGHFLLLFIIIILLRLLYEFKSVNHCTQQKYNYTNTHTHTLVVVFVGDRHSRRKESKDTSQKSGNGGSKETTTTQGELIWSRQKRHRLRCKYCNNMLVTDYNMSEQCYSLLYYVSARDHIIRII